MFIFCASVTKYFAFEAWAKAIVLLFMDGSKNYLCCIFSF